MRALLLLAWRAHVRGERGLALLTMLAIATSVALATGLELASRSAGAELTRSADALAGAASLEVSAGAAGVPEAMLPIVAATSGVRAAAPLVEATLRLEDGSPAGTPLHVVGIDLLADGAVREAALAAGALGERDPARLLAAPNAVIASEGLRRRLDLVLGSPLPVRAAAGARAHPLVVQGFLAAGGLADAFGGQLVLMDVFALQGIAGLEGRFHRIDVVLEPGADASAVSAALAERVRGHASVRRSSLRDAWVDHTLATLRIVVSVLGTLGIVVAALVASAAVSLAADRRLAELALLRLAGLEARRVALLLRIETALLGLVGALAGTALGALLARVFLGAFSGLSAYLEGMPLDRLEPGASTLGLGLAIGVGVALVASHGPARRARVAEPRAFLGAGRARAAVPTRATPSSGGRPAASIALLPLVPLALFGAAVTLPVPIPPTLRIALLLVAGLAAVALSARVGVGPLLRRLRPRLEVALPRLGRLAGAALETRPAQAGVTLASLTAVVAGVALTGILVSSVTTTLDGWTADQYPGGVLVFAGSPLAGREREALAPEGVARIRAVPGVEAVFDHVTTTVLFRGEEVLLAGSSMDVMAERGRLPALDGDPARLARALAAGGIAVSDAFSFRFGVDVGDRLVLDTPRGPRGFEVAGVLRDYAGPSGSLNVDVRVFDALWPRPGSSNLVLWTSGSREPVLDAVRAAAGPDVPLFFVHGEALERHASEVLARFTRLLHVVSALTALLGGIAVASLLFGAVLERRRELALLRTVGATSRQLGALVLVDGALLGAAAAVLGIALGLACAWPLVAGVIRGSLAWWIELHVDPLALAVLGLGVIAACVVAAGLPAWEAQRVVPREVFAPE